MDFWTWLFRFGSFLAGASISIFALSSIVYKINLNKKWDRLRYLRILKQVTDPVDVESDGHKKEIEIDPIKQLDDIFILTLLSNVSENDKKALSASPLAFHHPFHAMDRQKYAFYENRQKIPLLIETAKRDFELWRNIYRIIMLTFFLGLLFQIFSIIETLPEEIRTSWPT